jgi:hypothetical protein
MAYLNAETLLIDWFVHGKGRSDDLPPLPDVLADVPFSTNTPSDRPESFVTIERVGGPAERFQDNASMAVQAWAPSRWEAERLCNAVREDINNAFRYHPQVSRLEFGSMANFPDASGHPRFQLLFDFKSSAY